MGASQTIQQTGTIAASKKSSAIRGEHLISTPQILVMGTVGSSANEASLTTAQQTKIKHAMENSQIQGQHTILGHSQTAASKNFGSMGLSHIYGAGTTVTGFYVTVDGQKYKLSDKSLEQIKNYMLNKRYNTVSTDFHVTINGKTYKLAESSLQDIFKYLISRDISRGIITSSGISGPSGISSGVTTSGGSSNSIIDNGVFGATSGDSRGVITSSGYPSGILGSSSIAGSSNISPVVIYNKHFTGIVPSTDMNGGHTSGTVVSGTGGEITSNGISSGISGSSGIITSSGSSNNIMTNSHYPSNLYNVYRYPSGTYYEHLNGLTGGIYSGAMNKAHSSGISGSGGNYNGILASGGSANGIIANGGYSEGVYNGNISPSGTYIQHLNGMTSGLSTGVKDSGYSGDIMTSNGYTSGMSGSGSIIASGGSSKNIIANGGHFIGMYNKNMPPRGSYGAISSSGISGGHSISSGLAQSSGMSGHVQTNGLVASSGLPSGYSNGIIGSSGKIVGSMSAAASRYASKKFASSKGLVYSKGNKMSANHALPLHGIY